MFEVGEIDLHLERRFFVDMLGIWFLFSVLNMRNVKAHTACMKLLIIFVYAE